MAFHAMHVTVQPASLPTPFANMACVALATVVTYTTCKHALFAHIFLLPSSQLFLGLRSLSSSSSIISTFNTSLEVEIFFSAFPAVQTLQLSIMDLVSLKDDPFRELRNKEQLEALEATTEVFDEEHAKQLYFDYAYDLNLDKAILAKVTDPTDVDKRTLRNQKEFRGLWCKVMSRALVRDPHFQAAVLNEWQTPGLYDFSKLELIEQSLVGVYFPLLYHLYDSLSDYLHDVEKNHELPTIVNDAVGAVQYVLNEKIVQAIREKQQDSLSGKVLTFAPLVPKPAMPTLLALAQMEKRANQARGEVRKLFKELPGYMMSPAALKLLDMYTPGSTSASSHIHESLADSFAADVMERMKGRTPVLFNDATFKGVQIQPQTMPEDPELREHVSKATTLNDYLDEEIEEDVDANEAAKDAAASKDKQVSFSIEQLDFDLTPEESALRAEIETQGAGEHVGFPGWTVSENTLFRLDLLANNKSEDGPLDTGEGYATRKSAAVFSPVLHANACSVQNCSAFNQLHRRPYNL